MSCFPENVCAAKRTFQITSNTLSPRLVVFFLLIYFHRSILKSPKSPAILVGDEVLIHDNNRNKQGKMNKIHEN